jgi:hypothetical protein
MFEEVPDGDVFKSDPWFRKTTKLQTLVNGNFFRYDAGSYIRISDERGNILHRYDKVLLDNTFYTFIMDLVDKIETGGQQFTEEQMEEFRKNYLLAEFLMMCTSYNYYGEYTQTPDVDRRNSLPYYLEPVAYQADYVVFDITAIFSNMINLKYSYDRYGGFFDFYRYSSGRDWTLLGRLKNDIKKVRDVEMYQTEYHAIASDAIIRNSDVLLSLTEMMESNSRNTLATGTDGPVRRYKTFLEGLYNTGMKTYRIGEDGENYELHFSFIRTLSSVLDEVPEDKLIEILHSANDAYEASKTGISGVRLK